MATGTVRGVKAKIDLDKIEQEDAVEIIATITNKDGPLKEIGLVFFLNIQPISEIKETDPLGRASVTLEKPAPGNYKITAQTIEGDLRESISLIIKKQREQTEEEKTEASLQHQLKIAKLSRELEETKKRPEEKTPTPEQQQTAALEHRVKVAKLVRELEETQKRVVPPLIIPDDFDARVIGERGKPIFIVDTFVKNKGGCKGEVTILEDETGRNWTFPTNDDGKGTYRGPSDSPILHVKDRTYIVRVAHVHKEEKFPLEGPPPRLLIPWWLLLTCWVFIWGWFLIDYKMFGLQNPAALSAEYRVYARMTGDEKFYYERWHHLRDIPLPQLPTAEQLRMESWYGWIGWRQWFKGFLVGMGVVVLAMLNRIMRAWSRAQQRVWERREGVSIPIGSEQTPQRQSPPRPQTTAESDIAQQYRRHFSFGWEVIREVIAEVLADSGLDFLKKRLRKL